jgi:hypothetical protein
MALAVAGCATPTRGPAVPEADLSRAYPLGIPNARFYADGDPAPIVAEAALALTVGEVRPGLTERQVAGILEHHLRDLGSEATPFETIVAAGERSALPHARATGRVLRNDELLNEQQVLELLGGISRAQLRNMRERREVAYVRMGSGCRYYRSSIVAWVLRNTVNV